jgi:hypothetical protein
MKVKFLLKNGLIFMLAFFIAYFIDQYYIYKNGLGFLFKFIP